MKIAIGSDHAGVELKQTLKDWLAGQGHQVNDLGPATTDSTDYPTYAQMVAQEVADDRAERGILICGTGIGMAIAANRFRGVRAANCNDPFSARMSREHNDANILALGARIVAPGLAQEIVETWLQTPFQGGRHQRRLDLLDLAIRT
ncbi:MAG: ribose 5-phosphate isomerase B [Deltaproteobacteria bacterium]|nr:ribose 5-phosphate isomerase B [Deltaproteobacteria bacterium]